MKKLLDGGEVGRAESKNPAKLERTTWFYLSLFFGLRGRENQRHLTPTILSSREIHQEVEYFDELNRSRFESLPATKNHQGLGDSEDESDAKIFSVPDSETGQQSSPHIQLELMRRQPQQGNADRVLVENNFDTTSVTWRSKFSAVLLQLLCASAQLKLFSMTQTSTLFKLSDQG